jgi:WD40 repeat protein
MRHPHGLRSASGDGAGGFDVIVGNYAVSPGVYAWPWIDGVGFGTRYADPSTPLTSNQVWSVCAHPSGKAIALATRSAPYLQAYAYTPGVGWGTKYSDPTGMTAQCYAAAFSPSGNAILASQISGGPRGYAWSNTTGFGATISSGVGQNGGYEPCFHPSGSAVVIGTRVYNWSDTTGVGTVIGKTISVNGYWSSFNPAGTVLFSPAYTNPIAYPFSVSTGAGTEYSSTGFPSGGSYGYACAKSNPDGTAVTYTYGANPRMGARLFDVSTGWGTLQSSPSTVTGAQNGQSSFSPDGNTIFVANSTGTIMAFAYSTSTGIGTKYADASPVGSSSAVNVVCVQ